MINLKKAAMLGMGGGAVMVGNIIPQPKTQKGEKRLNNVATVAGLGAVTALGMAGRDLFKTTNAATFEKVGKYIEKSANYVSKGVKSNAVQKALGKVSSLLTKAKATKVGQAIANAATKVINKVKSNSIVKNTIEKAGKYIQKFAKAPTAAKGKYALAGAGVALLAYGAYKLVTNFFRKEGAIDQKYNDLREQYQHMIQYHPITDSKSGKPISFEDYCVIAQTKVY